MSIEQFLILSDLVEQYTLDYGKYIIDEMFPNYIDGLKIVLRRSLWAIKDKYPNYISSSDAIGLISIYHNHSPESTYDAMIRLCQDFSVLYPLFDLKGDKGSYSGDKPAASRYTGIKISEFGYDVYFKYTNKSLLSYKIAENLTSLEPKYLIPAFPMSLILYNKSVGFGFTSSTYSYTLEQILQLLKDYLEYHDHPNYYSKYKKKILERSKKYLHITTPIENNILNVYPDVLEGILEFLDYKSIVIKSLPYTIPFEKINSYMISLMKSSNMINEIKEASNKVNIGNYIIRFKSDSNIYKFIIKLLNSLKFTINFNYNLNYSKDSFILQINNPLDLLEYWFKIRTNYIYNEIQLLISNLKKKHLELKAKIILSKYPKIKDIIIDSKDDNESRYKIKQYLLKNNQNITLSQCNYIINSKLKILNKYNTEQLKQQLKEIEDKIKTLYNKYNTVTEDIYKTCEDITKKYKRTKFISKFPKYQGILNINNQIFLSYESLDKLNYYKSIFKKRIVNIFDNLEYVTTNNQYKYMKKISDSLDIKDNYIGLQLIRMKYKSKFKEINNLFNVFSNELIFINKSYPTTLLNIYNQDDKFYIKKELVQYKDINSLNSKFSNSISLFNINENTTSVLIIYWMSSIRKNKLRVLYIEDINKTNILPFRYGDDIVILKIIDINSKYSIINLLPLIKYNNSLSNKIYEIIEVPKLLKYTIKNNDYDNVYLSNFRYKLKKEGE